MAAHGLAMLWACEVASSATYLCPNACLDGDLEHLPRYELFQAVYQRTTYAIGLVLVDYCRQGVYGLSVYPDFQLYQLVFTETNKGVFHAGVALRSRLQLIKEIRHYFAQRQLVGQRDTLRSEELHVLEDTPVQIGPPLVTMAKDRTTICSATDRRAIRTASVDQAPSRCPWLLNVIPLVSTRKITRIAAHNYIAIHHHHLVDYAGCSDNEVQVVFSLQALLHNFHVQQPQKAAPKAEAHCTTGLGLELQGCVIQLQLPLQSRQHV
eukprot:scaffold771_cov387-Prasinococcus_capsulatus_cf.AAC.11